MNGLANAEGRQDYRLSLHILLLLMKPFRGQSSRSEVSGIRPSDEVTAWLLQVTLSVDLVSSANRNQHLPQSSVSAIRSKVTVIVNQPGVSHAERCRWSMNDSSDFACATLTHTHTHTHTYGSSELNWCKVLSVWKINTVFNISSLEKYCISFG